ncbi:MAG: tetratricopeptide repeat protein [Caulobacteraceae bacterium]|nr:tetratricopeptide repeat protein [Caulobacteraceae bacterium]
MVDVFEEVEEQIRVDRYKALAQRLLPWVAGALVLALLAALGVWGYQTWQERKAAQASETYAAALEAFSQQDLAKAGTLWGDVAKTGTPGYRALALMQQGGLKATENKTAEAVALYDQAAEIAPNDLIGDMARLKSALALLDTAPVTEMSKRLTPLTEEGRPYRAQAREALAFAKLMGGDAAGARGDFVVLSLLADAPDSTRERARAAMELIDSGSAASVAAAVKAAPAVPPASPAPQAPTP